MVSMTEIALATCVLFMVSMTVRWALCYVCFVNGQHDWGEPFAMCVCQWWTWLWDEPFAMCVLSVVSMTVKWALCYHCTRPLLCAACVLMSVKHNTETVKPAFCYVSFVVCEAWSTFFAVCFVFGACLCGLLTVAWLQSLLTSTYPEHFWWPRWPQGHRMSQK